MEPIGDLCQNVSQLPKFFILLEVLTKMKNRYHSLNRPSFPLPPGMTYRDIGLQARERISFRNPLDPLEGVQWNADLYARPRRNDPHWINVDLMNPLQTGMPHDNLTEITLGPYQIQLSMGYISSIQESETRRNNQYQDWIDYHEQCQELPDHYEAHLLHEIQEPPNWDNN